MRTGPDAGPTPASLGAVTDRPRDDDWVGEMLARAMLDDERPTVDRPGGGSPRAPGEVTRAVPPPAPRPRPAAPRAAADPRPAEPRPAAADIGPRPSTPPTAPRPGHTPLVADESPAAGPGPAPGGSSGTAATSADEPDPTAGDAAGSAVAVDEADERAGHGAFRSLVEWVVVVVGALAVALLLRTVLFQAFFIPSQSMLPTLQEDDRVLVNKLSYRLHEVNRGDIVVFERPPGQGPSEIEDLIKRVIALEGETVSARDGRIVIDDQLLIESYLPEGTVIGDFGPITVPEDHVFVMGDNRGNSQDSRVFGPVPEDSIIGRAFVLFWPLDRLGAL